MENSDFLFLIKQMSNEELIMAYLKRNEYAEEYVVAIEEEFIIRGYDPNEFTSLRAAQQQFLKQKKDFDLFELLNDKESEYPTDLIKQEIECRQLTVSQLEDDFYLKGKQGNLALLVGIPVVGLIISILKLSGIGNILLWISFIMAIYYLVASKKLSTGRKVNKYDEKASRRLVGRLCFFLWLHQSVNNNRQDSAD